MRFLPTPECFPGIGQTFHQPGRFHKGLVQTFPVLLRAPVFEKIQFDKALQYGQWLSELM